MTVRDYRSGWWRGVVEIDETAMVMEEAEMVTDDEKKIVCFYQPVTKG